MLIPEFLKQPAFDKLRLTAFCLDCHTELVEVQAGKTKSGSNKINSFIRIARYILIRKFV